MKRTISVGLTGHDAQFQLDEEAYAHLEGYLDRAAGRLRDDADRDEVWGISSEHDPAPDGDVEQPRKRRLRRIREGQQLAGVCMGIAAYAELPVDWVRTFFVLATIFTAGIFGLVYVALAFALPVAGSRRA